MATRSLATRMWTPAASALRRRLAPSMFPPAHPRFVDTFHSQAGYWSNGIPKSPAHDESLYEEFYRVQMILREREMELAKVHAEMKRVATRFVIVLVGLPLLEVVLKTF